MTKVQLARIELDSQPEFDEPSQCGPILARVGPMLSGENFFAVLTCDGHTELIFIDDRLGRTLIRLSFEQPQLQAMASVLVDLAYRFRVLFRDMSRKTGYYFALFAGVPDYDPLINQQWEQMWEMETDAAGTACDRRLASQSA